MSSISEFYSDRFPTRRSVRTETASDVQNPTLATDQTEVENSVINPPAAGSSSIIEVEGAVAPNAATSVERKFEWNLGRLFYQQPGESKAKAWAVRVLSVVFVLPVVLTAIVDLGRGLGFLAANKNATAAKYFDGKSWSLIDKMSTGAKAVAAKAKAVYAAYNSPYTKEQLNERSEKAMKAQAVKIVDGYRALNGGFFHSNDSFSTPTALNAHKQIKKAQKELMAIANEFLARNVSKTDEFSNQLNSVREKIRTMINEAAGDDEFLPVKTAYTFMPIAQIANKEFDDAFNADNQPVVAAHFVSLAKQEPTFAQSLKAGLEQNVLTPAQAKQAVEDQAPVVYSEGLETSIEKATSNEKDLLSSALLNNIITQEEVASIQAKKRPEVLSLALAAAKEIVREAKADDAEAIVTQKITKTAETLIAGKKLDPKDQSVFQTTVKEQLDAANEAVEAERKVQADAQAQAELQAKEDAEIAELERIANVKKAEDQASLFGQFSAILDIISKKQSELNIEFSNLSAMNVELAEIIELREGLLKAKVTVDKKEMGILEADRLYNEKLNRVSTNKKLTFAQRSEASKQLLELGFDQKTIDMIQQLQASAPKVQELNDKMAVLADKIKIQQSDLSALIAKYNVFSMNNKEQLETTKFQDVTTLEKSVREVQVGLNQKYIDLFMNGKMKKSQPIMVSKDPDHNRAEIEEIIKANSPAPKIQEDSPAAEEIDLTEKDLNPPSYLESLWNILPNMPWQSKK